MLPENIWNKIFAKARILFCVEFTSFIIIKNNHHQWLYHEKTATTCDYDYHNITIDHIFRMYKKS
jgi:hypothetical protein